MAEYVLIVKKIREMLIYNNIMLMQFPKYEKYLLANKIRETGYEIFEAAVTVNKRFHKKTTMTEMNVKHELLRQYVNLAFELKYIDLQKHRTSQSKIAELVNELGLALNAKTKISQIAEGIDFVGFRTHWNRKVIRKRTLFKIKRTCKKGINIQQISSFLAHAKNTNSLPYIVEKLRQHATEFSEFINKWLKHNQKEQLCFTT